MSTQDRINSLTAIGLYDDDANNHQVMARNRDVAARHAIRVLRDSFPLGAERNLVIVGGSAGVYREAINQGFAAHTLRPILEETDTQRSARLRGAAVPHCNCVLGNLLGPAPCAHHGFDAFCVLLCDVLAYVDPVEVRGLVGLCGSGRVVAIQMVEFDTIGAVDVTKSRECIQVYTKDHLYAYVAGNNGRYCAPRLSKVYFPGNDYGVSFSFKVRVGMVQVVTLGACGISAVGYKGEPISGAALLDVVEHSDNGFILVSRAELANIAYAIACPPSPRHDTSERVERIATQKCAALIARSTCATFTSLGTTIASDSPVVTTFDSDYLLGALVAHVLTKHNRRFSLGHRLRVRWERAWIDHSAKFGIMAFGAAAYLYARLFGPARQRPAAGQVAGSLGFALQGIPVPVPAVGTYWTGPSLGFEIMRSIPVRFFPKEQLQNEVSKAYELFGIPGDVTKEQVHNMWSVWWSRWSWTGNSSFFPHPMLPGLPYSESRLWQEIIMRQGYVCLAPFYEEWVPELGMMVQAMHAFQHGNAHVYGFEGDPLLAAEFYVRLGCDCLEFLRVVSRGSTYWIRVGLHLYRNASTLWLSYNAASVFLSADQGGSPIMIGYDYEFFFRKVAGALPLARMASAAAVAVGFYYSAKALGRSVSRWVRSTRRRLERTYEPTTTDKVVAWVLGASLPRGAPADETVAMEYNRHISDRLTVVEGTRPVASSPGTFAPEWFSDLTLTPRDGWQVIVRDLYNGVHRRDQPVLPSSLGLSVFTYANGLTPRNASDPNVHDFVQMAEGRMLNISQYANRTFRLDYARQFVLRCFQKHCTDDRFLVPAFSTPEFDEAARDFIAHFPVTRIREKWQHMLDTWSGSENDLIEGPVVYEIFIKMESWWKLSATDARQPGLTGPALEIGGKPVMHKPRAIWVPAEVKAVVSSIAVYQLAQWYKTLAAASEEYNIIYTSSMTGDTIGARIYRFLQSRFDPADSSTWFLLLLNGDDNWFTFHPEFTREHRELSGFAGFQSRMKEIGRNTEAMQRPLFASSFSSSHFLPALTLEGVETLVLGPCAARVACKLGTTLAALPLNRVRGDGIPSREGYYMWLRRIHAVATDFAAHVEHDPLGCDVFRTIATRALELLDDNLVGPVLRRGEREIMADEYQLPVAGHYKPHALYEYALEQWYGYPIDTIRAGFAEIKQAWYEVEWDGDVLRCGHVGPLACALFMRGLGNPGAGVPGFGTDMFLKPSSSRDLLAGEPARIPPTLTIDRTVAVRTDAELYARHLAAFVAAIASDQDAVVTFGPDVECTALKEGLVRAWPQARVYVEGRGPGALFRLDEGGVVKRLGRYVTRDTYRASPKVILFNDEQSYIDAVGDGVFDGWVVYVTAQPEFALLGLAPTTAIPATFRAGAYALMGSDCAAVVVGPLFGDPQLEYDRDDHLRLLAYVGLAGCPATLCGSDWSYHSTGLTPRSSMEFWEVMCYESDAAAFDNSTTEESIKALHEVLTTMADWGERSDWLMRSLLNGARFVSKGVEGRARWCWPSGIALTSFGGSIMNGMEVIECIRQCLAVDGIVMPLPL